jgi:hypothetical protein
MTATGNDYGNDQVFFCQIAEEIIYKDINDQNRLGNLHCLGARAFECGERAKFNN